MWLSARCSRQLDRDLAGGGAPAPAFSHIETMTYLEPIAGRGIATVETVSEVLQITAAERLRIAELVRTRQLPLDKQHRLPVSVIESLLREVRSES